MAQKDITQKNLEAYPDVFADIINAFHYGGKPVVQEHELQAAPTESFYHFYNTGAKLPKLKNQFQDVSMYRVQAGEITLCYMLENQSVPERKMILRKAGYEGAIYRQQFETKALYPVVGMVLYWGRKPWRSPRSLKELFHTTLTPEVELRMDDFRLDVYEMTRLPQDIRSRFHSDMRVVVDYLAEGKDYQPGNQVLRHPEAFLRIIHALTGDIRYEQLITNIEGKEEIRMCELLDKYENRGIQKGLREGKREGRREGRREGKREGKRKGKELNLIENISTLMETMDLTLDKAMEALRVPQEKRTYYADRVLQRQAAAK